VEVSKNLDGKITWPKKSEAQICEESAGARQTLTHDERWRAASADLP
jgi:hypothetical protein